MPINIELSNAREDVGYSILKAKHAPFKDLIASQQVGFSTRISCSVTIQVISVTRRKKIHCILGMKDRVIIAMSPDKANMSYWVKERGTVEETFAPLAAKLCNERTKMPRVIIFCRRYEDCA